MLFEGENRSHRFFAWRESVGIRRAAALLLFLIFVFSAFCPAAQAAVSGSRNAVGMNIAGFSTVDVHGSAVTGSVLRQHELTVIHYFATWSPECIAETDYMQEALVSYQSSGLLVLGLLYTDSVSTPEACVELFASLGLTYNCILPDDVLSSMVEQYPMIPQTFFVDRNGNVIDHFPGLLGGYDQLETIIRSTLGQGDVYHTVRFTDGLTGRLLARVSVLHGHSAIPPDAPEHNGYMFKGWDGDFTNVTEDRTVTAIYVLAAGFFQQGDVNMNGTVDVADAIMTLRFAMGLLISEAVILYGDMNSDGDVTVADAVFILRTAMGVS